MDSHLSSGWILGQVEEQEEGEEALIVEQMVLLVRIPVLFLKSEKIREETLKGAELLTRSISCWFSERLVGVLMGEQAWEQQCPGFSPLLS